VQLIMFVLFVGENDSADRLTSLKSLCAQGMEPKGKTSNHLISQSTHPVGVLLSHMRYMETNKLLCEIKEAQERSLGRLQALLTAHSWYHEDALQQVSPMHSKCTRQKCSNNQIRWP